MRSTELEWNENHTFKRFVHDLPIAARCLTENKPGPEIKVPDTTFQYFKSCHPYRTSTVGTAINDLDAPVQMDTGGNIGKVWTRVLHYHYNCDTSFQNCKDEEQFYLANSYGLVAVEALQKWITGQISLDEQHGIRQTQRNTPVFGFLSIKFPCSSVLPH